MDYSIRLQYSKYNGNDDILHSFMPRYLTSKHRVHRMFVRHCGGEIETYQTCIQDKNW
jgi:hypothetical protein